MKNANRSIAIIAGIIIFLAAVYRLTDHPNNFVPITAICLLGAAYLGRNLWSFLVPFAALFLSDFILNNYHYREMLPGDDTIWFSDYMIFNFISFALIILVGSIMLRQRSWSKIIGASILSSIIFFLVTNFGSWLSLPMYTKDMSGIGEAYTMGLPFFRNTIMGDLFFTVVLVGAVELYSTLRYEKKIALV